MFWIEAGFTFCSRAKAANEKPGADQQEKR